MALMERVTRRGAFLDLGQMDQLEFREWWSSMLCEGIKGGAVLLDAYNSISPEEWTAVAYVENERNVPDAEDWWLQETDGECDLVLLVWVPTERHFRVV